MRVDLSNFNLNLLLALDGLLSERSVTAAAKRVRVTPSAMRHSLSELRQLLGDPLLVRSGRGMVLTPRAEALVGPLHTLLMDAERLLGGGATFDPASAARRFVIAAPDFLATLLMPALLDAAAREAPGTSLEIVPSSRRGNAWLLETGDVDLALGAIVDEAPGIRRMDVLTDGFACAARKGQSSLSTRQHRAIGFESRSLGNQVGATDRGPPTPGGGHPDADRLYGGEWKAMVEAKFGGPPTIDFLNSPVMIDNVHGTDRSSRTLERRTGWRNMSLSSERTEEEKRMIYLTNVIYVQDGNEAAFQQFEDAVLPLLSKYRGELVLRLRPDRASKIDGTARPPYELHIVRFESEGDLVRYSNDEERQRLLPLKDKSVRETLLIKGALA